MKTRTMTLIGVALAAIALTIAPASARGELRSSGEIDALPDTFGGCYTGGGYSYSGGYGRGHYDRGYSQNRHQRVSYSERCRVIGRSYFHRGCYRYCRITYRHERIDCYGRVVSCWTSCRTVRA